MRGNDLRQIGQHLLVRFDTEGQRARRDLLEADSASARLARAEQVEAKLLANPRILVVDNETANFEIIRQVPFREQRQVGREDPITYTEFKDVGDAKK